MTDPEQKGSVIKMSYFEPEWRASDKYDFIGPHRGNKIELDWGKEMHVDEVVLWFDNCRLQKWSPQSQLLLNAWLC